MTPRRNRSPLVALAGLLTAAALAFALFTIGRAPKRALLATPNGFDDFIKAGRAVLGTDDEISGQNPETQRALISTNVEALRLLRLGLTRRCVMPANSALTNFVGSMNPMKRLVMLLEGEGHAHEMDNRFGDAARSYTDSVRFGNEMSRGGFLITRRLGVASEVLGCERLASILPRLTQDDARNALTQLEKIDANRVRLGEALRNERFHTSRQFITPRVNPIGSPIAWAKGWWQYWQEARRVKANHRTMVAHVRLLVAELALRCYQSEKGRVPPRLDDLVPNYLSRVPLDPFTGHSLFYRPQGTNWLLLNTAPGTVEMHGEPGSQSFSAKGGRFWGGPW
ncbi:MAG: hypothetical protein ACLQVX_03405 [Limisphaerales bacterium]